MPRLARLPLLAFLVALGCSPTAHNGGKVAHGNDGGAALEDSGRTAEERAEHVPEPPAATRAPAYGAVRRAKLENGPEFCAAERPDLAQTFVSLTLGGDLPPEEALLLREWLQSAWQNELEGETVSFEPSACAEHFLCLSGPASAGERLVSSLLKVLASPGQTAFYQMRAGTLAKGEEWDRNSADWKLNTAARALRLAPAGARLDPNSKQDSDERFSLIERSSGAAKLAGLSPVLLEKQLARALSESILVAAGPTLGAALAERVEQTWKPKAAKPAAPLQLAVAPDLPLRLEKYTPDLTQAALVWEFEPSSAHASVERALTLLVLRWEKRGAQGVRVRVQPATGIYSRPAIRVDGPHEQVLTTLDGLTEEFDRLISAFGAPSKKEWDTAELRRPETEHFEPRCLSPHRAAAEVEEKELARDALRRAGLPTVVIWGTDAPPELSE